MDRDNFEKKAGEVKYLYEKLENVSQNAISAASVNQVLPLQYCYFKINAIGKSWDDEDENGLPGIMQSVFGGLYSVGLPFSMIAKSEGDAVEIYYGFPISGGNEDEILLGLLQAALPSLELEMNHNALAMQTKKIYMFEDVVDAVQYRHGGFIKGNPTPRQKGTSLDLIINGMKNKKWCVCICAYPIPRKELVAQQSKVLSMASKVSELLDVSFSGTDNKESTSSKKTYYEVEKFSEKLEGLCKKFTDGLSIGAWNATIQYAAPNESDAKLLSGLLVSSFYGEESKTEPMRSIRCQPYTLSSCVIEDSDNEIIPGFGYPKISNMLTGSELAVYAALPTADTMGFAVKSYVEFDVARSVGGTLDFGKIIKNGMETASTYALDFNELNRHCLVVGLTGSGKTNTTKNILHNVYYGSGRKLPIMVIEPAKKEYWELYKLGFDDLQIYTVGSSDPMCNPYCLNPFERVGNVSLQTHIDNVYAAFKASFIMYTPMPYVLERAIYEIYEDYGWDLKTNTNTKGTELYPTIEDLYWKIPVVVTAMGYDQKMRNDLIGSLQARINSLRLGAKGDTLNVRKSFPICEILQKNVVIELEDIGDDDVKAFIISMLLIQLAELRRQEEDSQLKIKHLLLIEEAHRLLKNVRSGSGENADPRGAAVEFFCNLLAELRSKGQGFLIADQIPSKLAPDLIKNTNVKIVHRTVDKEDRELMGGAMHMTEEQTDYLSSLGRGEAAIYSEGDNRPKLMKPAYAATYITADKSHIQTERQVLELTKENCYRTKNNPDYTSLADRNIVCRLCKPYCTKQPEEIFERFSVTAVESVLALDKVCVDGCFTPKIFGHQCDLLLDEANVADKEARRCARSCMLCHMLKVWDMDKKISESIVRSYFGR